MPHFVYKAVNLDGDPLHGEMDAADPSSVMEMIRSQGFFPLEVKEEAQHDKLASGKRIGYKTMATFCVQISTVLRAGVPLTTALEIMRSQLEDKHFKAILDKVYASIQNGNSLSESFRPYRKRFPLLFLNMVEAGEVSGTLETCLLRAGESFTKTNRLNGKIRSALTYPMVLLFVTVAIVIFLLVGVLPMFEDMFTSAGSELPPITQFLIDISNGLKTGWPIVLGVVFGVVIAVYILNQTEVGQTTFGKLRITMPMIGKHMLKVATARYSRALSTLSASGLSLVTSLEVAGRAVQNRYLQKKIEYIIDSVKNGEGMSQPLARVNVFPPMVLHMTRLGEESGSLETLLEQTALFYEEESESAMQAMAGLLEPAIIVVMGGLILFIVLAIFIPMLQMGNMIG